MKSSFDPVNPGTSRTVPRACPTASHTTADRAPCEVASEAHLPRSRAYELMRSLVRFGLCTEVAGERPSWAFVNVNMRPYYAEGSKTLAYEIAEQLGWRAPDAVVVPIASGALFSKVHRGFGEHEFSPDVLVAVCDSVRPDVKAFGREMVTRFFQESHGHEYLLRLSEHPSANLQLFSINYLERFAAGSLE